jgi:NADPH:quinone reductase-like Zn-dependent oxidoreductase
MWSPGCARLCLIRATGGRAFVHTPAIHDSRGSDDRFLAVGEELTSKIPAGMDVHQAAAIPLATLTGNSIAKYLRPESRVLVLGGASATGSAALQVARVHKAGFVAATCSPRSDEYVKFLGADMTVDYRTENVWEVMKAKGLQFDVIFHTTDDVVPGDTFNGAVRGGVLANGGQLISITGDKQQALTVGELCKRGWQLTARNVECRMKHGGAGYQQCVECSGCLGGLAGGRMGGRAGVSWLDDQTGWMTARREREVSVGQQAGSAVSVQFPRFCARATHFFAP